MAKQKTYMVHFTFDANDHALKFPLMADVEITASGEYTISNIRQDHRSDEALLPPIRLRKDAGVWVFVETENASRLSAAIGAAIDRHQNDNAHTL